MPMYPVSKLLLLQDAPWCLDLLVTQHQQEKQQSWRRLRAPRSHRDRQPWSGGHAAIKPSVSLRRSGARHVVLLVSNLVCHSYLCPRLAFHICYRPPCPSSPQPIPNPLGRWCRWDRLRSPSFIWPLHESPTITVVQRVDTVSLAAPFLQEHTARPDLQCDPASFWKISVQVSLQPPYMC